MEKITIDTIIDYLRECVEKKFPIGPAVYFDAAFKLNVLLQDLDEELIKAESDVANIRILHMKVVDSVSKAERLTEAEPAYARYRSLKAKKDRVVEFIKIAKKRTTLPDY